MKEIEEIIKSYDEATAQGKKTALATVVHVEGSSYRRPGARMLISEEGALTGAISGGCLEGDALRKALLVIMQQQSMLVTYDTNDEADAIIGMGLGCNGIIQVLIEPLDTDMPNNPIMLLKMLAEKEQPAVLVTLFSLADKKKPQPGTCLLFTDSIVTNNKNIRLRDALLPGAAEVLKNRQSAFRHYKEVDFEVTAFTEFIAPAITLVVIGAGNDVFPLVSMAAVLGWKTTIIDGRPAYARKQRFPASCSVLLAKPEQVTSQVAITDRTAVLLMTHNYNYDLSMLPMLTEKPTPYVGMLGPKKKLDRMLTELEQGGKALTGTQLAKIYSPVGLHLGAETAEEIALSILAEIQAVFASAKPIPLKDNAGPIHDRAALAITATNFSEK